MVSITTILDSVCPLEQSDGYGNQQKVLVVTYQLPSDLVSRDGLVCQHYGRYQQLIFVKLRREKC